MEFFFLKYCWVFIYIEIRFILRYVNTHMILLMDSKLVLFCVSAHLHLHGFLSLGQLETHWQLPASPAPTKHSSCSKLWSCIPECLSRRPNQ